MLHGRLQQWRQTNESTFQCHFLSHSPVFLYLSNHIVIIWLYLLENHTENEMTSNEETKKNNNKWTVENMHKTILILRFDIPYNTSIEHRAYIDIFIVLFTSSTTSGFTRSIDWGVRQINTHVPMILCPRLSVYGAL